MSSRPLLLALWVCGCGVETGGLPPPPDRVELSLETRDGDSALGWSFASRALVPFAESDLHVNAFDCGARGRWVNLVAAPDVRFCDTPKSASCASQLSVGGTDDAFTGLQWVRRGDVVLGRVELVAHSPTPDGWEQQSPFPAYDVTLEISSETLAAPR